MITKFKIFEFTNVYVNLTCWCDIEEGKRRQFPMASSLCVHMSYLHSVEIIETLPDGPWRHGPLKVQLRCEGKGARIKGTNPRTDTNRYVGESNKKNKEV